MGRESWVSARVPLRRPCRRRASRRPPPAGRRATAADRWRLARRSVPVACLVCRIGRRSRPVYDSRYGHRCRGGSAGRGCPGHCRYGRATGPVHRNPCTIDREPSGDPQRTPARSSPPCPAWPSLPPDTGLIGGAGGAGVLSQALHLVQRAAVRGAADPWWGSRRLELVTTGEQERCDRAPVGEDRRREVGRGGAIVTRLGACGKGGRGRRVAR